MSMGRGTLLYRGTGVCVLHISNNSLRRSIEARTRTSSLPACNVQRNEQTAHAINPWASFAGDPSPELWERSFGSAIVKNVQFKRTAKTNFARAQPSTLRRPRGLLNRRASIKTFSFSHTNQSQHLCWRSMSKRWKTVMRDERTVPCTLYCEGTCFKKANRGGLRADANSEVLP